MRFDLRDVGEARAIITFLEEQRRRGFTIGLTSGCFDLIHFQHFRYFASCRQLCDILVVGVDCDQMVREEKGPNRPFIYDHERAIMVDALKPVSYVFVMNTPADLKLAAELIRPTYIFRNQEFLGREHEVWGREFAEKGVVIIHDVKVFTSTTEISQSIAQRLASLQKQTPPA